MRKIIYAITVTALTLTVAFSAVKIFLHLSESNKQEEIYDNLAQLVEMSAIPDQTVPPVADSPTTDPETTIPSESIEPVILPEYLALYEQNNDLVGWISIEDTRVNYPVVQSLDSPNFYLTHGFDKGETDYGCPYVAEICDVNPPSDNLIIYGHHKKNGSMFSDLKKYRKQSFWENHKTFRFDTIYERQTYEVVAVFITVVYTKSPSEFKYYHFDDAETPAQFNAYIEACKARALYDTGVTATYGDKLITLSTCEYTNKNGRLVVVAKRVD